MIPWGMLLLATLIVLLLAGAVFLLLWSIDRHYRKDF